MTVTARSPKKLMIVVEKDDQIVGMLLANIHGQFYTDIKVASQQLFLSTHYTVAALPQCGL